MSGRPYWPICLYGLSIIIVSSIPGDHLAAGVAGYDKIVHGVIFGGFNLLLMWTVYRSTGWSLAACVIGGILLTSLFGIVDELHQLATPHRSTSALDVVADITGACIAALCFLFLRWRCRLRKKSQSFLHSSVHR